MIPMSKKELRGKVKRALAEAGSVSASKAGHAITRRVTACDAWSNASTVALFSSLPDEIETEPLWVCAQRDLKKVAFPRMSSQSNLEFALVESPEDLVGGRYGILEPSAGCPQVSLTESDLIIVPGLAFDRGGGRLGRGAGYYDRALARAGGSKGRPRLCGVGFAVQLLDEVPMTLLDVRMDAIATEEELIWIR